MSLTLADFVRILKMRFCRYLCKNRCSLILYATYISKNIEKEITYTKCGGNIVYKN